MFHNFPLRECRPGGTLRHENLVMSAKNPVGDNDKATAVVADDWEETLKRIGGSQSDDWNHVLGNQAIQSLWIKQSDNEAIASRREIVKLLRDARALVKQVS
jgi:hypothetical protein